MIQWREQIYAILAFSSSELHKLVAVKCTSCRPACFRHVLLYPVVFSTENVSFLLKGILVLSDKKERPNIILSLRWNQIICTKMTAKLKEEFWYAIRCHMSAEKQQFLSSSIYTWLLRKATHLSNPCPFMYLQYNFLKFIQVYSLLCHSWTGKKISCDVSKCFWKLLNDWSIYIRCMNQKTFLRYVCVVYH